MSIDLVDEIITVSGPARVEDAEPLLALLQSGLARQVDLSQAGSLHTAVMQVLLAYRPPLIGPAGDRFTENWLMPLLGKT